MKSAHDDQLEVVESGAKNSRRRSDRADPGSFSKRLGQLVHGAGMRQSVLARKAGLEPYLISNYMLGKAIPSQVNLLALAKALDVAPEALLPPSRTRPEPLAENSPLAMIINPSDPSRATLRVNMEVSFEVASEIVSILSRHRMAESSSAD